MGRITPALTANSVKISRNLSSGMAVRMKNTTTIMINNRSKASTTILPIELFRLLGFIERKPFRQRKKNIFESLIFQIFSGITGIIYSF